MQKQMIPIIVATGLLSGLVTSHLHSSEDDGKLGPVDSITLSGSQGDVTITNTGERISWGDEETSKAWSVGFMETGKAIDQLMQADHFVEAREDLEEELEEEIASVRKTLDEILERGRDLDPNNPSVPEVRKQWEQTYKKFEQLQKKGIRMLSKLASDHLQESYKEVLEAVNVIADRMNIDIVLRFIPPEDEFKGDSRDTTLTQIRLRTALRVPKGIDITDEVLSELGLEMQ